MAKSIIAPPSAPSSPAARPAGPDAELKSALNEVDMLVQGANESIGALARSISMLLREPDSGNMRLRIKALCELIEYTAGDLSNTVNCIAEQHGAHFIDEGDLNERSLIWAAVRDTAAKKEVQS